jgi:hypothetical protein
MESLAEVEQLRRSIAMLSPGQPAGMNREDAMRLLGELVDVQRRLQTLKAELRRLAEDD